MSICIVLLTLSPCFIPPRDVIEEECYQKLLVSIPNFATRLAAADEEELKEIAELVHLSINPKLRFLSDLSP